MFLCPRKFRVSLKKSRGLYFIHGLRTTTNILFQPGDNFGGSVEFYTPSQDVSLFHVLAGFVDHVGPLVGCRRQLVEDDGGDEPEPSLA